MRSFGAVVSEDAAGRLALYSRILRDIVANRSEGYFSFAEDEGRTYGLIGLGHGRV